MGEKGGEGTGLGAGAGADKDEDRFGDRYVMMGLMSTIYYECIPFRFRLGLRLSAPVMVVLTYFQNPRLIGAGPY